MALSKTDIKIYLTGASSDGGAQTDPAEALGRYRSSTELVGNSQNNLFPAIIGSTADSGDYLYLALNFKNENGAGEDAKWFRFFFLNTDTTTTSAAYSGSGDVTIQVTDGTKFDESCGFIYNVTTDEVMFYSARSGNNLTVLAADRGLRGTSATGGTSGDTVVDYPWTDICSEVNAANKTTGAIQQIADIYTEPTLDSDTSGSWSCPFSSVDQKTAYANGLDIDNNSYGEDLADGDMAFCWFRLLIPANCPRNKTHTIANFYWDANN